MATHPLKLSRSAGSTGQRGSSAPRSPQPGSGAEEREQAAPQQQQARGHRRQTSAPSPGSSEAAAAAEVSPAQLYSSVTSKLANTFSLTAPLAQGSATEAEMQRNRGSLHNRSIGRTSARKDLPPLFWYMEAGKWERATQRAKRHPREFKTWVNIKTKTATVHEPPSPGGTSSTKRLALHHACFKLRSAGALPPPSKEEYSKSNSQQQDSSSQEPDPFVQACNFILLLVSLYPEAAGQRESRHGCLPLHLAAFASCMTRASGAEGDAISETSSSSSMHQSSSLQRPSSLSRRCASDTTTATHMSAIHAEESNSGGMMGKQRLHQPSQQQRPEQAVVPPTQQQTRPATFVAAMNSWHISPKREAAAVQVMNALLDAYPKAIRIDSEGGRLPLHTACAGRATPRVVACLVTAYPAAARHRNKDGFLPLHLAAHWGVSHPAVAITLLKAYPDATVGRNRWERTPLEEALCMAGENGRPHQAALVRALRKHPSFWTQPVDDLLFGDSAAAAAAATSSGGTRRTGRSAAPVDVDESLASTTEDGDEQQYQHLYSPSPREQAVVEDRAEEYGQEVVAFPQQQQQISGGGGFVGRLVSGMGGPSSGMPPANYLNSLPLHKLIQNRHWPAVMERLHSNPLQAEDELHVATRGGFMASTGMTALHYACERDPPLDIVQALLAAYPMAILTRCMPGGCLPLHIACTWHCQPAVVDALLYADAGGAKVRDELGNVALHSACFSGAHVAVISSLLEADGGKAVVARNHQGSLPIDVCKRLRHDNRQQVIAILTRQQEDLLSQWRRRKHRRNPSSGGWSAVAKEAEELNQRYGAPGGNNNNSDHGPDMRESGPAVEVTFEQQENPELQWI